MRAKFVFLISLIFKGYIFLTHTLFEKILQERLYFLTSNELRPKKLRSKIIKIKLRPKKTQIQKKLEML